MERIAIIFGGRSEEHEISLLSAKAVIDAFDKNGSGIVTAGITKQGVWKLYQGSSDRIADGTWEKYAENFHAHRLKELADFAFPVLHGPYGEDGTIQGLFEMLGMPYAGSGVLSSALCMDKAAAKMIFEKEGFPICGYMLVHAEELGSRMEKILNEAEGRFHYPMFIKPSNMGSSIGVSKAKDREGLRNGLTLASRYDRRILVEEGLDCRDIETAVTGNFFVETAAAGEIIQKEEFYNYRAKYTDNAGTELLIPAAIPPEACQRIRELAVRAYRAMDCSGFARVDFFMEKKTGKIYLNEINTIPGFTKYSMFPLLWEKAGVGFPALVERIVEAGYERYYVKNHRQAAER